MSPFEVPYVQDLLLSGCCICIIASISVYTHASPSRISTCIPTALVYLKSLRRRREKILVSSCLEKYRCVHEIASPEERNIIIAIALKSIVLYLKSPRLRLVARQGCSLGRKKIIQVESKRNSKRTNIKEKSEDEQRSS